MNVEDLRIVIRVRARHMQAASSGLRAGAGEEHATAISPVVDLHQR